MKKLIAILCLLSVSTASRADFVVDTLFVTDAAIITSDWLQTRNIARRCPDQYHEENQFLGPCPTVHGVNQYFLTYGGVLIGANYLLPKKYRDTFLLTIGVIEGRAVLNNTHIGLTMKFK